MTTQRETPGPATSTGRARLVDTVVLHGGLIDFRTLCQRAVSPRTRYLVLDLDRTFHFGRNLGELLGWELCAFDVYGRDFLLRAEPHRTPGRFIFDRARPIASARYVARGARLWAYPGLLYLFAIKLGMRSTRMRPWIYRTFGSDPVEAVQQVPRNALMHQLSDVPIETLRDLSRCVWNRFEADQVIQRGDIAWLRDRCPGIRIIVSSASPQPVLEVAAEQLDVDEVLYTAVEEHDGYLSAPYALNRMFLRFCTPRRISPPSQVYVNAGKRKMTRLLERHPDFLDPDVETVGITDTKYGEDHAWADFFKVVVDINSPNPFAPIVASNSPLREVHSALVLTRAERANPSATADRRRPRTASDAPTTGTRTLSGQDLRPRLEGLLHALDHLAERHEREVTVLRDAQAAIESGLAVLMQAIEVDVKEFNASVGTDRRRALRRLRHHLRENRVLQRRLVKLERPLAALVWASSHLLELSRKWLEMPDGLPVSYLDYGLAPWTSDKRAAV
jgi:hypothetical protein